MSSTQHFFNSWGLTSSTYTLYTFSTELYIKISSYQLSTVLYFNRSSYGNKRWLGVIGNTFISNKGTVSTDFRLNCITSFSRPYDWSLLLIPWKGFSQRIYISKRTESTPLASSKHLHTQPLLALSAVCSNYLTIWQSRRGERLGGQMFGRRKGVLSVLLLIYILWLHSYTIWLLYRPGGTHRPPPLCVHLPSAKTLFIAPQQRRLCRICLPFILFYILSSIILQDSCMTVRPKIKIKKSRRLKLYKVS